MQMTTTLSIILTLELGSSRDQGDITSPAISVLRCLSNLVPSDFLRSLLVTALQVCLQYPAAVPIAGPVSGRDPVAFHA